MTPAPPTPRNPLADGLEWAAKIMACALLMVGPALLGAWVDSVWQTKFVFLVGMFVGFVLGGGALLALTMARKSPGRNSQQDSVIAKHDNSDSTRD